MEYKLQYFFHEFKKQLQAFFNYFTKDCINTIKSFLFKKKKLFFYLL